MSMFRNGLRRAIDQWRLVTGNNERVGRERYFHFNVSNVIKVTNLYESCNKCLMVIMQSTEWVTRGCEGAVPYVLCTYVTHPQSPRRCVVGWKNSVRHLPSARLTCML